VERSGRGAGEVAGSIKTERRDGLRLRHRRRRLVRLRAREPASERPDARVLLLEAGPADTDRFIHLPVGFYRMTAGPLTWGYRTAPLGQADRREMIFPQGRVLGGGSSINAMVYARGHALDYDEWAWEEGCVGWSYAEVLPYFRRAEDNERFANRFHGTGGPLGVCDLISPHYLTRAFVRAAREAGLPYNPDFNGERQEGCGLYQVTQRGARRCSAAVGYLKPALARGNLTVLTGCHATRILVERGRAVGVEYRAGGKAELRTARAEQEVVVASGAVGSPRLLLLSGIGPADELERVGVAPLHDLPGVGRNLQDHIDVYVICELAGPHSYDRHTRPHRMLWAGVQYLLFGNGPVTSNLAEGGAFWYADTEQRSPDIQFHFLPGAGLEAGVPPVAGHGCTLNSCHLRPRSRGSVRLQSADPRTPPLIDPNYWAEPYDFEMSLRGFALTREIMAQPALRRYVKHEHLPGAEARTRQDLEAYARRFGKTDYHPVGTCKMGVDALAVVDPQLRVRGLDRLRVVDSSIMPRLISSNTNAASIMIGEKGSDLIKGNRAAPLAA
jgi:choline dehydrogenase